MLESTGKVDVSDIASDALEKFLVAIMLVLIIVQANSASAQNFKPLYQTELKALLAQEQAPIAPPPAYRHSSSRSTLTRGVQLIDTGRLEEALALFQDYCRRKPLDSSGFFWAGVCFDEMSNYAAAAQAYRYALSNAEQLAMDSSEIRTNLGNTLLKQNKFDEAIESFKKALEINPLYGLAELNLGRAYIAKGDFKEALLYFDKCDELHFSAWQLRYYRAKALMGLGRKNEAGAVIQRLLQDLPVGESKNKIEQELQSCLPN